MWIKILAIRAHSAASEETVHTVIGTRILYFKIRNYSLVVSKTNVTFFKSESPYVKNDRL